MLKPEVNQFLAKDDIWIFLKWKKNLFSTKNKDSSGQFEG